MAQNVVLFMMDCLDHFKHVEWALNTLVVLGSIKVCTDLAGLILRLRGK